jgi:hypothetical protein
VPAFFHLPVQDLAAFVRAVGNLLARLPAGLRRKQQRDHAADTGTDQKAEKLISKAITHVDLRYSLKWYHRSMGSPSADQHPYGSGKRLLGRSQEPGSFG